MQDLTWLFLISGKGFEMAAFFSSLTDVLLLSLVASLMHINGMVVICASCQLRRAAISLGFKRRFYLKDGRVDSIDRQSMQDLISSIA